MSAVALEARQLSALAYALATAPDPTGSSGPRAGCLLARQSLELVVDALLSQCDLGCPEASMKARLICLRYAYRDEPAVAHRAATLWAQLSSICHHHAYELDPSRRSATSLIEDLDSLIDRLGDHRDQTMAGSGS